MNKYQAAFQIVRRRLLGLIFFFALWLAFLAFLGMLDIWTGLFSFLIVFVASFFGALMRVNKNTKTKKK